MTVRSAAFHEEDFGFFVRVERARRLGGGFGVAHAWYLGFAAMVVGSALAAVAITLAPASSEAWRTGAG